MLVSCCYVWYLCECRDLRLSGGSVSHINLLMKSPRSYRSRSPLLRFQLTGVPAHALSNETELGVSYHGRMQYFDDEIRWRMSQRCKRVWSALSARWFGTAREIGIIQTLPKYPLTMAARGIVHCYCLANAAFLLRFCICRLSMISGRAMQC
jgi:hypothetical protein